MLKRKLAATVIAFAVISASCTSGDQKKLAAASQDAGLAISTLLDVDKALIDAKLFTRDEGIAYTSAIQDVNHILEQFRVTAKTYDGSATVKAQLVSLVASMSASIQKLNDQGALHIKNPEKKAAVDGAIAALRSALAIVSGIVGGAK